jgi:hypothetical protein
MNFHGKRFKWECLKSRIFGNLISFPGTWAGKLAKIPFFGRFVVLLVKNVDGLLSQL